MVESVARTAGEGGRTGYVRLVVLLGLLNSFAPFSTDMYLAAFPVMARDMHTGFDEIQLTLSVFFLGLAAGQLIYGPLSDRLGRRRPLLMGLALYTLSTLVLVFARDIQVFTLFRFMQALGGCAGMVICRAVVRDSFDVAGSARVLTVIMAVQTVGPVVAPVAGAYLVTVASWGASFVFMVMMGVTAFLATFLVLRESLPEGGRVRQSPAGLLKGFVGLLGMKSYIFPAFAGALGNGSIFAFITASPYVLMDLYGLSAAQYGLSFAALSVAIAVVSQTNIFLLKRFGARPVFLAGLALIGFFGAALALRVSVWGLPGPVVFMVMLFLSLMCLPLVVANSTAIAMAGTGRMAGLASSLLGVMQFAMAGVVSFMVGVLDGVVAFPMGFLIAMCGIAGFLAMLPQRGEGKTL
jgi:DHA1 family bicyclomycin/chloramphenicol resistance-like MFS transporter